MRLSSVANAVSEISECTHQLIVTGSNYPEHFRRLDVAWLVLPHSNLIFDGNSKHRFRAISSQLVQRLIIDAISAYTPDAVVFDTYASLEVMRMARSTKAKITLIFRECRDQSFNGFYDRGFFNAIDRMIIPHDEPEFLSSLGEEARKKLARLKPITEYVGPIAFPLPLDPESIEKICRRFSLAERDTVIVITCGGGGFDFAAWQFLETACLAAARLRSQSEAIKIFLVGGPLSRFAQGLPGVTFIPELPDLQVLMARADVVVSHGGYNSVNEILRAGARAIVVPVHRHSEDQHSRVRRLSEAGRVKCLSPEDSVETFLQAFEEVLGSKGFSRIEFSGAKLAAASILRLAGSHTIITVDDAQSAVVPSHDSRVGNIVSRVHWHEVSKMIRRLELMGLEPKQVWWEVGLGTGETDSLVSHTEQILEALKGVPPSKIFLWFVDPSGGLELKRVVTHLSNFEFASLVAKIPAELIELNARQRQEMLEELRRYRKHFTIDVISISSEAVICDQG
jgi:predicted glycosyltransferase